MLQAMCLLTSDLVRYLEGVSAASNPLIMYRNLSDLHQILPIVCKEWSTNSYVI